MKISAVVLAWLAVVALHAAVIARSVGYRTWECSFFAGRPAAWWVPFLAYNFRLEISAAAAILTYLAIMGETKGVM